MHAWMYRSIAEALQDLKDQPTWQEYALLVEKVFGDQGKTA